MTARADEAHPPREKVAEIERLAMALAARLRYAQMVSLPVPPEQLTALARAARMLEECRVPSPSLVRQVLREAADGPAGTRKPLEAETRDGPGALARLGRHLFGRSRRSARGVDGEGLPDADA